MAEELLTMTFDPNTIEHLGVRMYSTLPPVIAELISNAYDADADWVKITLIDNEEYKKIIVEDNGDGMTFEEIGKKFLRIGRNRREKEGDEPTAKGRKIIGKKGLGKLSFFGIAHEIEIATKKAGKENVFVMSWQGIQGTDADYHPVVLKNDEDCSVDENGTTFTLTEIQRASDFEPIGLVSSLSKIFIIDPNFEIIIQHNDNEPVKLDNETKFADLEIELEWAIPDESLIESTYERKGEITGKLITAQKPISPRSNMRGIVLFSRKKLVNLPEYFSESASSHFYSYLTGWLEVDFIDDLDIDVIATNRQSLNWDHPELQSLREYLQELLRRLQIVWREKRAKLRERKITEVTNIDIGAWFSKVPEAVREHLEPLVLAIVKDSELPDESHIEAVKSIHELVPEYTYYHWRHLHSEIQDASRADYERGDYYRAFIEAAKRYITAVRTKSGSNQTSDFSLMSDVFSAQTPKLKVAQNYLKPNGNAFTNFTIENIESGQRYFSQGVVSGCRNPLNHEEREDLIASDLFSEKDCLDALSLLSHLFRRLDNAVVV